MTDERTPQRAEEPAAQPHGEEAPRTDGAEGQHFDRKSLRLISGSRASFLDLACGCVGFANASGGKILIGIEDDATEPPPGQRIDPRLLDQLRKRIGETTVNVEVVPELRRHANGGDYIVLTVQRSIGAASTSDGRYFLRVDDECRPVVGDDVFRLTNERPGIPWEVMTTLGVPRDRARGVEAWAAAIRASDRVKASVKEKSDQELLDHYGLASGELLTNLGALMLGSPADLMKLGTAPIVQAIRYDERGEKIGKHTWDDYTLSPAELVDAVWREVPDFREAYEIPEGMSRTTVPAFDEAVVRELLVNALVHRPYTQRGDIYLNLHPDRLEIVNPGRLPLGVTPRNILHESRRRNDGLARVFHDLKLMEREGSGVDLVFELLLASGRGAPEITEGPDSVRVVVPRRVVHPGVIRLLTEVDAKHRLTQRERITLALLAQTEGLSAAELAEGLELPGQESLPAWMGRLLSLELVRQTGSGRSARYVVPGALLRGSGLDLRTTLSGVQPHRLRALVVEDLERFPDSSIGDVHRRIGPEIPRKTLQRALAQLVAEGRLETSGKNRWLRYRIASAMDTKG